MNVVFSENDLVKLLETLEGSEVRFRLDDACFEQLHLLLDYIFNCLFHMKNNN